MKSKRDVVELRFMVPHDDVSIIDAVCIVMKTNRSDLLRKMVHEYAESELHRAEIITRVVHKDGK